MWILWTCIVLAIWLFIGVKFWWLFLGSYNYNDGYHRSEPAIKEMNDFINRVGYTFVENKIKVVRWPRFILVSFVSIPFIPVLFILAGIMGFIDSL